MDHSRFALTLAAFLSLLPGACSREQSAPKAPPSAASGAPDASPSAIAYPARLVDAVNTCCPALHLPRRDEARGAWADSDGAGSVAFYVEGDFNGDGAKDAAAFLVAADGVGVELAVFEGAPQGRYVLAHRHSLARVDDVKIAAPQQVVLRLVRRGEEWAPEGGDVARQFAHPHEAVAFETRVPDPQGLIIAYQHLLYWDGKAYSTY